MNYTSLSQIRNEINKGKITCVKLVENYLNNIQNKKYLNAFLEVYTQEAIERAYQLDEKIKTGTQRRLAGLIIGIKDNICYKGHISSAASKMLEGFTSLYNATVVERLLNEDAIIIGRLNCDEFAMGSSNENSAYGKVLNFHNSKKVAGGSSGGSAVAVAADLCLAALGTDTGGSIRQPASFCGVIGYKPSYGRISRHGVIAFSSSFDQVGTIAKSIEDIAIISEVISGADDYDTTCVQKEVPKYSQNLDSNGGKKLAYFKQTLEIDALQEEVKQNFLLKLKKLKGQGHTVKMIDFEYLDYLTPCYYVLSTAEASSNLARYNGIHYGHRNTEAKALDDIYKKSRTEGFGREVKRRIMLGTFVLSSGYYDAYYSKAQKVRRMVKEKMNQILSQYDFVISPTTPSTAFEINRKTKDPTEIYLEDILTVNANITGMPAISVPSGIDKNNLPTGIQLVANNFEDLKLLCFAKELNNL